MKLGRLALSASPAFAFVSTMGSIVNLFGDITYEGGGAINGPFLGTLGASAAAISIIAGAGEFLGYNLRAVAGYLGCSAPFAVLVQLASLPAFVLAERTKRKT